ncbi:hypothetical protein EPR50_G00235880 [Perca flavescens]|uniref:Uncharacterized protein n=1 Tax=Perca flavescens TaxID=8167 RepID=A0A484BY44_PERFV|nr:hypothetical protein EPR50_G00235880 [Perca flavescens]
MEKLLKIQREEARKALQNKERVWAERVREPQCRAESSAQEAGSYGPAPRGEAGAPAALRLMTRDQVGEGGGAGKKKYFDDSERNTALTAHRQRSASPPAPAPLHGVHPDERPHQPATGRSCSRCGSVLEESLSWRLHNGCRRVSKRCINLRGGQKAAGCCGCCSLCFLRWAAAESSPRTPLTESNRATFPLSWTCQRGDIDELTASLMTF